MQRSTRFTATLVLTVLAACEGKPTTSPGDPGVARSTAEPAVPAMGAQAAEIHAAMDPAASPCQDFYQYACGGWLATHEIPEDKPFTSRVAIIDDRSHELLRELLEQAAEQPGDDQRRTRIGGFYAACMDQAAIDAAGVTPLGPALAQIATVKDLQGAYEAAASLRALGVEAFMFAEMDADYKAPRTYLLGLRQGGLGLPVRDYYVQEDEQSRALLDRYTRHIADMLVLVGDRQRDADRWAPEIVALETALARASLPLEQLREIERTYHKTSVAALRELTPGLDWRRVFAAAGNPEVAHVNVATPEFFRRSSEQLRRTKSEVLRAYLRWQLIRATAEHLSGPIEARSFAWTATLTGQRALPPRWRRCVDRTVTGLPEAVGRDYVDRAFAGASKPTALAMIVAIEQAFERGLGGLGWMDEVTRGRAREKVAAIGNKIGFPDRWREEPPVTMDRRDYFGNRAAVLKAEVLRQLGKADRPVDPDEWLSPVSVINAYANPLGPDMTFPAAILQPPLFSLELPMAVNYAAIGAIMGHEITHHFDDQGRRFDAKGALAGWWTDAAVAGFETATGCVARQYDAYELAPGQRVNGRQTLGENIADIGGLKFAHAAYMQWAEQHPERSPVPGLDAEQLFFVAYAQTYCSKQTLEFERARLLGDVHSPWRFRVIGPLASSPAFAAAFSCAVGTPMRPARVCSVW